MTKKTPKDYVEDGTEVRPGTGDDSHVAPKKKFPLGLYAVIAIMVALFVGNVLFS